MFPLKDDNPTAITPRHHLDADCGQCHDFPYQAPWAPERRKKFFVLSVWGHPAVVTATKASGNLVAVPPFLSVFTSIVSPWRLHATDRNMWFLWIIGQQIEEAMGHLRYLAFYVICGLLASSATFCPMPGPRFPRSGRAGPLPECWAPTYSVSPRQGLDLDFLGFFIRLLTSRGSSSSVVHISAAERSMAGKQDAGGLRCWAHVGDSCRHSAGGVFKRGDIRFFHSARHSGGAIATELRHGVGGWNAISVRVLRL